MGAQGLLWGVVVLALVGVTSPTRTIMAINAGGDTTIAADGEVFERDRYYQGGVVSKKGKDLFINGTNSPALYQVRRCARPMRAPPPRWQGLAGPCAPRCAGSPPNARCAQTERFAIGEELWYSLPIPFNVGHNGRGWTFVLTLKVRPADLLSLSLSLSLSLRSLPPACLRAPCAPPARRPSPAPPHPVQLACPLVSSPGIPFPLERNSGVSAHAGPANTRTRAPPLVLPRTVCGSPVQRNR